MAPDAGFEPATKWLTATYSTAELIRNKQRRDYIVFLLYCQGFQVMICYRFWLYQREQTYPAMRDVRL